MRSLSQFDRPDSEKTPVHEIGLTFTHLSHHYVAVTSAALVSSAIRCHDNTLHNGAGDVALAPGIMEEFIRCALHGISMADGELNYDAAFCEIA